MVGKKGGLARLRRNQRERVGAEVTRSKYFHRLQRLVFRLRPAALFFVDTGLSQEYKSLALSKHGSRTTGRRRLS